MNLSAPCTLFIFWVRLDVSLAVSDPVVLHSGGNSSIHCIGVSICEAEVDLSSKVKLMIGTVDKFLCPRLHTFSASAMLFYI